MSPVRVDLAGQSMLLDPHGALFWPAERLLAVADLHFEKGSSAARGGSLLPPWDTRATLERLCALVRRYSPGVVVALGDSFHDPAASSRLHRVDLAALQALTAGVERFVWVEGNHDPRPPQAVGGEFRPYFQVGRLLFRHQAARLGAARLGAARLGAARLGAARLGGGSAPPSGEVSGHFHPKAQVPVRGAHVTRPCFVCDGRRLLMPALGAYTGGLDVRNGAIARLFPRGGRVFLLGRDRLYAFGLAQLGAAVGSAEVSGGSRDVVAVPP